MLFHCCLLEKISSDGTLHTREGGGLIILIVAYVSTLEIEVFGICLEGGTIAFLGELIIVELIVVVFVFIVAVVNLWQVLVTILVVEVGVGVLLLCLGLQLWLFYLWFLFYEDGFDPCALWYLENLISIFDHLVI